MQQFVTGLKSVQDWAASGSSTARASTAGRLFRLVFGLSPTVALALVFISACRTALFLTDRRSASPCHNISTMVDIAFYCVTGGLFTCPLVWCSSQDFGAVCIRRAALSNEPMISRYSTAATRRRAHRRLEHRHRDRSSVQPPKAGRRQFRSSTS